MKKPLPLLLSICLLLTACGQAAPEPESGRLKIVTTVFPAYDFARAAAGGLADVELLLPPGTEGHSYEPTPADIRALEPLVESVLSDDCLCVIGNEDTLTKDEDMFLHLEDLF